MDKALAAVLLLSLAGCVSSTAMQEATGERAAASPAWQGSFSLDQEYDFAYVMRRSKHVKPGMKQIEVLLMLGRPKEMSSRHWEYIPQPIAFGQAIRVVKVSFEDERVTTVRYPEVMFGIGTAP